MFWIGDAFVITALAAFVVLAGVCVWLAARVTVALDEYQRLTNPRDDEPEEG